jgi:hypothetical protein
MEMKVDVVMDENGHGCEMGKNMDMDIVLKMVYT